MFLLSYLFVFHIFMSWNPCYSQYVGDTSQRILKKIINMVKELVLDAMVKLDQVEILKRDVESESAYKLGHLQYQIRDRIRRILIIYRHTDRLLEKNLKDRYCITETIDVDNLYHDAITFIEMIKLVMKVDNLAPISPRFRSDMSQQMWRQLVDTQEKEPVQSTTTPPVKTPSGKRRNGAWNYAPEPEDNLFK